MERKEKIYQFLNHCEVPLTETEIMTMLEVPAGDRAIFCGYLDELCGEGKIIKTKRGRYAASEKMGYVPGTLSVSEKGFGFVIPFDQDRDDIFIAASDLNGAMHRDKVLARITNQPSGGRCEGEIYQVISRGYSSIVGRYEKSDGFGFVTPDEKRIHFDIFIPENKSFDAQTGEKVVVTIVRYPENNRNPEGEVIERLGFATEPGIDVLSVIRRFALKDEFDPETLEAAQKVPGTISESDLTGRRDFRDETIITIDGEDSKDLDDAVSIRLLDNGHYRLGVHIADVTHYVRAGSPLDREAFQRGTSVYLADRVIPMLPVELSNGICSLNPHVDRLALSVVMEIDQNGMVVGHELCESVICSAERMTYKNVTKILQHEDPEIEERYRHIERDLNQMLDLALILRKKRVRRGAVDFDFPEARAVLDENGVPVAIEKYEVTVSNRIIEEFMLVANETVAQSAFWRGLPFVYRIHEKPSEDKVAAFELFLHNFGFSLKRSRGEIEAMAFQRVMNKVRGTVQERIISTAMLRSLMKAVYSPNNEGHFALAAKYYTHFTSPIRRYPDLCIHRILKMALHGELDEAAEEKLRGFVSDAAAHSSECERMAEDAEREVFKLKAAEFMKNHIGEEFDGVISSVTNFGMFVELENTIEGLVRIVNLDDDYYVYDEQRLTLTGEHSRKTYRIGDVVRVLVVGADDQSRQIDFVLSTAAPKTIDAELYRHQNPDERIIPYARAEKPAGGAKKKSSKGGGKGSGKGAQHRGKKKKR